MDVKLILSRIRFPGSSRYWDRRYVRGGTSGSGSYGEQAEYKARFLNGFVETHGIGSVIEFGCGDGNQLSLAAYPRYFGLDVSPRAIDICLGHFKADLTKSFALYEPYRFADPATFLQADMSMSLDVIYHLIEDDVYDLYMHHLFAAALKYVVVYATCSDGDRMAGHVRHRDFSRWIHANAEEWQLDSIADRPEPSYQDFFIYSRASTT